jgi:hypothetical protein
MNKKTKMQTTVGNNYMKGLALLAGLEFEVRSEILDIEQVDDTVDLAYPKSHFEIVSLGPVELDSELSVRELVIDELKRRGVTKRNRRWFKRVHQMESGIEKDLRELNPYTLWSAFEIQKAANKWQSEQDLDDRSLHRWRY